jgi:hypothetical protein
MEVKGVIYNQLIVLKIYCLLTNGTTAIIIVTTPSNLNIYRLRVHAFYTLASYRRSNTLQDRLCHFSTRSSLK